MRIQKVKKILIVKTNSLIAFPFFSPTDYRSPVGVRTHQSISWTVSARRTSIKMSAFTLRLIGALKENSNYNPEGNPTVSAIHLVTQSILEDSKLRLRRRLDQMRKPRSSKQPPVVEILCGALGTFSDLWRELQGLSDKFDRDQVNIQFFQLKFILNMVGSLKPDWAKLSDPAFDASDELNLNQLGFQIVKSVSPTFSIDLDLDQNALSVVFLPFAPIRY